ncbi:oxidation resistance protein 1-like [Neltuma alba]|uniref:oxidation resistance protein 1-like n=1 Tax=Neltuma alba TaxID=207710 RepID=UPI0010A4B6B1|nr:oxidation resistance protein 1-like [Prosopis alba]XP_028755153.1 oxidation resistance protein 1-like [Prosopis alba]XP_028803109.1 oxidation resistance protein 1-like [Prosopis alba]
MGRKQSLRSKTAHFVSDLTTVLLNPISDKPSKAPPPPSEGGDISNVSDSESTNRDGGEKLTDGPDTSSFSAFLYSFLSSSDSRDNVNPDGQNDTRSRTDMPPSDSAMKENTGKRSLFSRGKQSVGRAINQAARITGFRSQERKDETEMKLDDGHGSGLSGVEMRHIKPEEEHTSLIDLPEASEPSALLSEKMRNILYASLPALIHGRKWMLLYSTQRHGMSLLTLYRRSMLWPGLSLLVVGDRKGAVFGGLVEAPLKPSNKKYQGTSNTFVFTNASGHPTIYRPTGINRYFTLCSSDFLALGGGGHFALYLDGDLLNGSSSVSETYGNPCLAHSQDFEVKEVELWGFVYGSKYEEVLALSRAEAPGICRWC